MAVAPKGRHDIQQIDTEHNDNKNKSHQHYNTQQNNFQDYDNENS
jgi:hypothetical protein